MPEAASTEREGEAAAAEGTTLELEPADKRRLTDLVYRLLSKDIALVQERRGETARRWR